MPKGSGAFTEFLTKSLIPSLGAGAGTAVGSKGTDKAGEQMQGQDNADNGPQQQDRGPGPQGYGMPAPNPAHYAYNNGQPLHGHPQQQYPNMQQAPYPPVGMQHVPQPQGQAAGYYQNGPPPQQAYAPPQQQGPPSYQQPPSGGYAQQPPQQYAGHGAPAQGLAAAPGLVGGVYLSHSANAALPGAPVDPELLQAKHVIDQNPNLAEDLETEVHQMQVLQQVKDMNAAAEQAILKESKKKGKKEKKDKKGKSKSRRRRSRSRSRSDDSDSYDSDSSDSD